MSATTTMGPRPLPISSRLPIEAQIARRWLRWDPWVRIFLARSSIAITPESLARYRAIHHARYRMLIDRRVHWLNITRDHMDDPRPPDSDFVDMVELYMRKRTRKQMGKVIGDRSQNDNREG